MPTTAELVTGALSYYQNAGSDQALTDPDLREKAAFFLRQIGSRVWTLAPWWFKLADGQVTVPIGTGIGPVPADFSGFGDSGEVYLSGTNLPPLEYRPPDVLLGMIQQNPQQSGYPRFYTLHTETALGLANLYIYPVNNVQVL